MKKEKMLFVLICISIGILSNACTKDKMEANDEEVITTMKLTLTPANAGSGTPLVFQFDDPDGPGGMSPSIDQITLQPNTSYNVIVQLLNKTTTPAEDITKEVKEEADAHRFYYTPSAGSNITVSNLDTDTKGVPLGITSTWSTGTAATGKMKVTLRHYPGTPPNKALSDAVDDPKSATDLEVEFSTKIQ